MNSLGITATSGPTRAPACWSSRPSLRSCGPQSASTAPICLQRKQVKLRALEPNRSMDAADEDDSDGLAAEFGQYIDHEQFQATIGRLNKSWNIRRVSIAEGHVLRQQKRSTCNLLTDVLCAATKAREMCVLWGKRPQGVHVVQYN
eukprot:scaffold144020_cov42-Prasinocladus_malaysianus.AAC.1